MTCGTHLVTFGLMGLQYGRLEQWRPECVTFALSTKDTERDPAGEKNAAVGQSLQLRFGAGKDRRAIIPRL